MTRLVGTIKGPTLAAAKEQIAKALSDADLFEIRLDLLEPKALPKLSELPRTKPLLLTFRKKAHGGARELTEQERLTLFEKCLTIRPEYCDIEFDTDINFWEKVHQKYPEMKIISSYYSVEEIAEHFEPIWERMQKPGVFSYKMALLVNTVDEALRLMAWAQEKKNLTAIAMGVEGQVSRILSPVIKSDFCFASVDEVDLPFGQLTLKSLSEIYRFKHLNDQTKIYALLGDPVEMNPGHVYHNETLPKGSVYVKLHMPIPDMPFFFSIMRKFPFRGFSVAVPLKEQLGRFLTQIDPAAEVIGSVNTISVQAEHLIGFNTDGRAALDVLEQRQSVKGRRIVILGAGGSARAIALEAMHRGAQVTVLNRTVERAAALAKDFGCEAGSIDEFSQIAYDILINTIPVALIFDSGSLHSSATVMDIVYWESETSLLKAALERGCTTIHGLEVFQRSAALQQDIWSQNKA